jgi:hypothetical protein
MVSRLHCRKPMVDPCKSRTLSPVEAEELERPRRFKLNVRCPLWALRRESSRVVKALVRPLTHKWERVGCAGRESDVLCHHSKASGMPFIEAENVAAL